MFDKEAEVLLACKPTPHHDVQFRVPLVNGRAAGPLLALRARSGGGGARAGEDAPFCTHFAFPVPEVILAGIPASPALGPTLCEANL